MTHSRKYDAALEILKGYRATHPIYNTPLENLAWLIGTISLQLYPGLNHEVFMKKFTVSGDAMNETIQTWHTPESQRAMRRRRQHPSYRKITAMSPESSNLTNMVRAIWPDIQEIYRAGSGKSVTSYRHGISILKETIKAVNKQPNSYERGVRLTGLYILRHVFKEISRYEYKQNTHARNSRRWNIVTSPHAQTQIHQFIMSLGLITGNKGANTLIQKLTKEVNTLRWEDIIRDMPRNHEEVTLWLSPEIQSLLTERQDYIRPVIHILSAAQRVLKRTKGQWDYNRNEMRGCQREYELNRVLLHILHGYQNARRQKNQKAK